MLLLETRRKIYFLDNGNTQLVLLQKQWVQSGKNPELLSLNCHILKGSNYAHRSWSENDCCYIQMIKDT